MKRVCVIAGLAVFLTAPVFFATAQGPADSKEASATTDKAAATHDSNTAPKSDDKAPDEAAMRIEGEKRFRTNCGRCHMPPHKFPPRVMATAIRHMRVRAMLTEEDMRLILKYMTQ